MVSPFASMARRIRGTTLMEVLVVIVIFLVGILAIVQIFPRGFQILITTRNNAMASALARAEVERLKSRPDQLPDMIVSARLLDGVYVADPGHNPNDLGPRGNILASNGILRDENGTLGPWQLWSGANSTRRVIGEGGRVPAPRAAGNGLQWYGGVMVLQFGPIDYRPGNGMIPANLAVYGNDLAARLRDFNEQERWSDAEFFMAAIDSSDPGLRLPSGPEPRRYRITFSAYVPDGMGGFVKRDYIDTPPVDVAASTPDMMGRYPLFTIALQALVPDTIGSVDANSLRVQRVFQQIPVAQAFSQSDPYEVKLVDNNIGVLLFNPLGYSSYFVNANGQREALQARANYDVYDWRILREDFRLAQVRGVQQFRLSIPSLMVANEAAADGQLVEPIPILEMPPTDAWRNDTSEANEGRADNFVLVDLTTGGVIMERLPSDRLSPAPAVSPLITVNKSAGVVTFRNVMPGSTATYGKLRLPDGSIEDVPLEGRALRALYRTKNEFSAQVLKAASSYNLAATPSVGVGQYYVGGSGAGGAATRLYFPRTDIGRKVTVGEINYFRNGEGLPRQIIGQDFVLRVRPGDPLGLPSADLQDVDPQAIGFSANSGAVVRSVKGASVAVRVLWNPDKFFLTGDSIENLRRLERWGQSYRRTTNETYLERGEIVR
jgi:hypothetical protein